MNTRPPPDDRLAYVEKTEFKLADLEEQVSRMEARVREAPQGGEAQRESKARTAELDTLRGRLKERLAELRRSTDDAWTDLRDGVEKAYDELKQAVVKAGGEFRKSEDRPEAR